MLDLSNVWPEWRATDKVGEGSYGKVYRCVRNEYGIESVCAIKVISIPQSDGSADNIRFEGLSESASWAYLNDIVTDFSNEIKLMEMLKNAPNIVSVENYKIIKRTETIGWDIYIRMEFLTSFPEYASAHKMTEEDVFKLAKDICTALSICTAKGIIHRDIKPDNIFVDEYGNYKLGDFGVARKLEKTMDSMSRKGTYSYMAPEVYREEHYDTRADIYSLGTVMYKLLNNNRDPFIDANQALVTVNERSSALARRRRGETLPPPAFASPEATRIILKACAFNPDDRYDTVDEFKADIIKSMHIGTAYFGTYEPSKNKEDPKPAKKIRVFEIDYVGDKFLNAPMNADSSASETSNPEGTKIFSSKSREKLNLDDSSTADNHSDSVTKEVGGSTVNPTEPHQVVYRPIRPMDKESDLPFKRPDVPSQKERGAVPNPISGPSPAKNALQANQTVQGPQKKSTAQPPHVKPASRPPEAPSVDDSAAKKPPVKAKISGGRIAAIIAVLIIIVGAVAAAAYFLPGLLQKAKDYENNVDTSVDYTVIIEKENGYNVEKYNADDILFEVEEFDDEDKLKGSVVYVFDKDGKPIGYNKYNKSGQLIDEIRY